MRKGKDDRIRNISGRRDSFGDQSHHSRTHVEIVSLIPFMGPKTSGSSREGSGQSTSSVICSTIFCLNECTVTDPFYVVSFRPPAACVKIASTTAKHTNRIFNKISSCSTTLDLHPKISCEWRHAFKTDEVYELGLFSPKSICHDQDCQN